MTKCLLTHKAVEDLSKIWDYTYEAWSENQADKYYELIVVAFQEIAENSTLGKSYKEISKEILGFKAGKHIIFYRELTSRKVEIIRVLHERMDIKNRIGE